jgi:hypothetical protein
MKEVDKNALRLAWLREYLDRGIPLADAVRATNEHFKGRTGKEVLEMPVAPARWSPRARVGGQRG